MRTVTASLSVSVSSAFAGLSAPECILLGCILAMLTVLTLPIWIFLAGCAVLALTVYLAVLAIESAIRGDTSPRKPRPSRPVSIPLPPRPVRQTPPPVPQPAPRPAAKRHPARVETCTAQCAGFSRCLCSDCARKISPARIQITPRARTGYRTLSLDARQTGGYRPVTRLTESYTPRLSVFDGSEAEIGRSPLAPPPYVPQSADRIRPEFETTPLVLNDQRREALIRYFEDKRNSEKPTVLRPDTSGQHGPAYDIYRAANAPLTRYSPPARLDDVRPVELSALVSVDPGAITAVLASAYADGPENFDEESATPLPVVYPIVPETVERTSSKRPRRVGKRPAGPRVLTPENLSALLDGPRETVTADAPADALGTVPAGWESTGPSDCFDLPTEAELDTDAIRFATEVEPTDKVGSTAKILPVREEKGPADEGYAPASDGLDQIARAGLRAICRAEKIAYAGKDTPAVLREKIRAARAR